MHKNGSNATTYSVGIDLGGVTTVSVGFIFALELLLELERKRKKERKKEGEREREREQQHGKLAAPHTCVRTS